MVERYPELLVKHGEQAAAVEPQEAEPDPLRRYAELFVVNPQIHARQTSDGAYYKVDEPVSYGLLRKHLAGEVTLGLYATSPTGERVKWVCLDNDQEKGLYELAGLAHTLREREIPSLLEGSRRGGHLWVFFDDAPTVAAREYFLHLVEEEGLEVEVFPKVEDGLSLVRAPLGVHRKANRRYPFYEVDTGRPVSMDLAGNLDYVSQVERADVSILAEELAWRLRAAESALVAGERSVERRESQEHADNDRGEIVALKEGIGDLRDFIGLFVELNHKGRGSCPFHPPDEHASFAVHDTFWVCFHETQPNGKYLGGDVIAFWQRYRGVDFSTALEELRGFTTADTSN